MEDRNIIKIRLSTLFLIIAIIVIIIMGFAIYKLYNYKNTVENNLISANANISSVSNEQQNIVIQNNSEEKTTKENTNSSNEEQFVVPSLYTGKLENENDRYIYDLRPDDSLSFLSFRDGKPYISWNLDNDPIIADDLKRIANECNVTINNKDHEITGFTKKVVEVHSGLLGQDIVGQVYIFLMEDGTIEYSTIQNMIKNASTQGKIENLKNIVKIQDVDIGDREGGGCSSIIAIDKDNNCYDLDDYIEN